MAKTTTPTSATSQIPLLIISVFPPYAIAPSEPAGLVTADAA